MSKKSDKAKLLVLLNFIPEYKLYYCKENFKIQQLINKVNYIPKKLIKNGFNKFRTDVIHSKIFISRSLGEYVEITEYIVDAKRIRYKNNKVGVKCNHYMRINQYQI